MELSVLEQLQDIAYLQNIEVGRYPLPEKIRGLYYEEGTYRSITINSTVTTINEEVDVMAEEIGHSVIGGGDLFFPGGVDPVVKRKLELRAKDYAYNLVIPAKELLQVMNSGKDIHEIAEEFSVTECFVQEAIASYRCKGLMREHGCDEE